MNGPLLALAFSLAATLPLGAIGWAAGRLTERLGQAPRLRAALWSGVILLTLAAAAAVPLWRAPPAAIPHQIHTTIALGPVVETQAAPAIVAPAWTALIAPATEALVGLALAGSALALLLLIVRLFRTGRLTRRAAPLTDPVLLRFVSQRAEAAGLTPPPVRISAKATTAMLVGLSRPVIVLPQALSERLDADELRWICAHELAHLQRGDNWRVLGDRLIAALMWFNPFVTDAIERRAAVREELCDATALRDADACERRRYAATLVQALRLSTAGATHSTFIRRRGTGHIMRLQAILQPNPRASRTAVVATAVVLAATAISGLAVSAVVAQQLGKTSADAASAATASKYRNVSAMQLQRFCASRDPGEGAYCAGAIGGALAGRAVCLGKGLDPAGASDRARPALLAAKPKDGEAGTAFVWRVLKTSFPCSEAGVYHFLADGKVGDNRTFRIITDGKVGDKKTFFIAKNLKGKLSLVLDDKDLPGLVDGEVQDGKARVIIKDMSLDGVVSDGDGKTHFIIKNLSKGGDGDVLTFGDGAKIKVVANMPKDGAQAEGARSVSTMSSTVNVDGKPHVIVRTKESETQNGQHTSASYEITADSTNQSGDTTTWNGHPTIKLMGASTQHTKITVDGKPTADGTDLNTLKVDRIDRIEMHTSTDEKGVKSNTLNIVTKPGG